MKTFIIISSFMLLLASCQSHFLDDQLLHEPVEKVNITVKNEIFTVGFSCDEHIRYLLDVSLRVSEISNLKTRDDIIKFYDARIPDFQPGYSSIFDFNESVFVKLEYMLAQECFSDRCDSNVRKKVLQLAIEKQKAKWKPEQYISPSGAQKTGVFLMAVIQVKEYENYAGFIEHKTLQQALSCLSDEDVNIEELSNILIEYSEAFLTNVK